jgi:hypothetical protein
MVSNSTETKQSITLPFPEVLLERNSSTIEEERKANFCGDNGMQQVTESQRTPEWFLL